MNLHGKFVTAITCIDGRVQIPVITFLKSRYRADHVDLITEPGADRAMTVFRKLRQAIQAKAEISVKAHHSTVIAVVGHHDCAGNPVSKDEHLAQIREAMTRVQDWGFPVEVIGLWVNDQWQVEEIAPQ